LLPVLTEVQVNRAGRSDPDTYTYEQAMASPYREQFIAAMLREIRELEAHGTWDEVYQSEAGAKIVPTTWTFKIKRKPDNSIDKHKGRFCIRGDLESDRKEDTTFAPLAAWSTIRIVLILAVILGWFTCTCDFSNAFVQAKIDKPTWIHLPRGFKSTLPGRACLSLNRSLYGSSISPRLWYEHLSRVLVENLEFSKSDYDPCLFYKKDMMVALYCDDCCIACAHEEIAEQLVTDLNKHNLKLTKEDSLESFLGIKFERDSTGAIHMTQPGLIEKIVETMDMKGCKPMWTPAAPECLGKDPEGAPMDEDWNYASVVGMLLYLSTNTRPDIAFAVSQVGRFTNDPKESHAKAVKRIVRYLAATKDKGTIVQPTGKLDLEAFVDSDFGGLYGRDPDRDPSSAKSRMGYIVKLSGCPLIWKSQLLPEITISTLESEYSSCSLCLRAVLPLRRLLIDLAKGIGLPDSHTSAIHARVFQDNNGALAVINNERLTSRTKYFHLKWHHFWGHSTANGGTGEFTAVRVETSLQDADYLTKGLPRSPHEENRYRVQGW
jgi:histone deacetylase 1/2